MADWQRHLKLNPEWDRAKDGEITVQDLARSVAEKLRALRRLDDDVESEKDDLVAQFEDIAASEGGDEARWFDDVMHDLYNWGDTRLDGTWNGKKVCWIDTHSVDASAAEGAQ